MATTLALVALAVLTQTPASGGQTPPSDGFTTKLAGREVKFNFSTKPTAEMPADVLAWDGWKYLAANDRVGYEGIDFHVPPADMAAKYTAVKEKLTDATPVWHQKVIVITRGELRSGASREFSMRRESIDKTDLEKVLQEVAKFGAYIETAFDGKMKVDLDVEVDEQPMHVDGAGETPIYDWADAYLAARLNGGGFEADDKVYRGPYDSVFIIHPNVGSYARRPREINGTPYSVVSYPLDNLLQSRSEFGEYLAEAWPSTVRTPEAWVLPGAEQSSSVDFLAATLALAAPGEPGEETLGLIPHFEGGSGMHPPQRVEKRWASPNLVMSIKEDAERGSVLSYVEGGWYREGSFYAPTNAQKSAFGGGQGGFLQFWAKTTANDPVAVSFGNGDQVLLAPVAEKGYKTVLLKNDGQWHQVAIAIPPAGGTLEIGAPRGSMAKFLAGPVEVLFDDFEVVAGPVTVTEASAPVASFESSIPAERVLAVTSLSDSPSADEIQSAIRLMNDPSDIVRLHAVSLFTRVKTPAAVQPLVSAIRDLNSFVGEEAIRALDYQDSPEGLAAIRRLIDLGADDTRRAVAVEVLGKQKDPKLAGPISTTIIRRYRGTKMAAVRALAALSGEQPALIMTAFLNQEDPQVRLEVVRYADVNIPSVRRQILYTAVNDESDLVRAESYARLLKATDASVRAEGAKGVRDEGLLTRLWVVQAMDSTPNEEFRNALRLAVVDPSPRVRAAAIRALARLPKGVKPEEIENTLADTHPWVQLALLDIAETNGFKLPGSTVKGMESSKFSGIAQRAAKLPR